MNKGMDRNLKLTLIELVRKSGTTYAADTILKDLSKPKDKSTVKQLLQILKTISKHSPAADQAYQEITNNCNKLEPLQCLIKFLETYKNISASASASTTLPAMASVSGILSPEAPETISDLIPAKSIMEMKKRVVAAASSGLSKSARSSSITTPISSPTITLGNTNIDANIVSTIAPRKNHSHYNKMDMMSFQYLNASALPIVTQEQVIIAELLYCLCGIRGTYITPEPQIVQDTGVKKPVKFIVSEQINCSLRHIVDQILPLATYYSMVEQFTIQQNNTVNGSQILQALGAAMRELTNDYYLTLVQLETEQLKQELTLHKLQYYLRPTMQTMSVLAETVSLINKAQLSGAHVLTLLYDKISALTGDVQSQNILVHLTERAALPYIEMLELWILKGVINDPQQEFMIEDNEVIRREEIEANQYSASYWERRYSIRRERIPRFLENVSDIILRTGKYLNVIRQCGNQISAPLSQCKEQIKFTARNEEHIVSIKNAYRFASRTLLELLVKDKDLMGHLTSVKRYLLMQQGDFISQFMDASDEELAKNINEVLPMRLENLLGLTLRLSSAKHDQYKDELHCELFTVDVGKELSRIHLAGTSLEEAQNNSWSSNEGDAVIDLTGIECFSFRYDVHWPVSLILNHFALSQYKMMFRLLFYCKHVERQLCKAWMTNKNVTKLEVKVSESYRFTFLLRQKMMYIIQNIEYYMMIEVVEPLWHEFLQRMAHVENVDDVLIAHQDFVVTCLENCMLRSGDLLRNIINLCKICLEFCKLVQSETKLKPSEKYLEKVKNFELEFSAVLLDLLAKITAISFQNPSSKFINLLHRINFNSFYTEQVELHSIREPSASVQEA